MTFGNAKYFNTVNHKTIGTYYIIFGYWAGLGGSVLSMLIRFELSRPGGYLFFGSGQVYNSALTMHDVLIDVFPRVNALSSWFTFVALLMVYQSFFIEGGPGSTRVIFGYYNFGFAYCGLCFLLDAINFIITTQNMFSTAVTLDQISMFVWTSYLISFLLVLSVPDTKKGCNPLLYQHLFWFFWSSLGYVIILPVFGINREAVLFLTDKDRLFVDWVLFLVLIRKCFLYDVELIVLFFFLLLVG
uniref:Cytochrome c oxidase subunit 1 n=1 Tax=Onchocerca flexuosa TaxID=387005 RepID=A0A183HSJ3_9BILA